TRHECQETRERVGRLGTSRVSIGHPGCAELSQSRRGIGRDEVRQIHIVETVDAEKQDVLNRPGSLSTCETWPHEQDDPKENHETAKPHLYLLPFQRCKINVETTGVWVR